MCAQKILSKCTSSSDVGTDAGLLKDEKPRMIKNNSNLITRIQTRYELTRKINTSIVSDRGSAIGTIATLIDEIAKELKQRSLGFAIEQNLSLDLLLWMDDVCLIHHDLNEQQEILYVTNNAANKYYI